MNHQWSTKGRWYILGSYVHRDDVCCCGCIRRVAIDPETGKEMTESYTLDENVTILAPNCRRNWDKQKKEKAKNTSSLADFIDQQEENYLIITIPK